MTQTSTNQDHDATELTDHKLELTIHQLHENLTTAYAKLIELQKAHEAHIQLPNDEKLALREQVTILKQCAANLKEESSEMDMAKEQFLHQAKTLDQDRREKFSKAWAEIMGSLNDGSGVMKIEDLRTVFGLAKAIFEDIEDEQGLAWKDALLTLQAVFPKSPEEVVDSDTETDTKSTDTEFEEEDNSEEGSVDEDIWDRNVDPVCMDYGSASSGNRGGKDI